MNTIRDNIRKKRAAWDVVSIGAHKFWKVPSKELLTKPLRGEPYALLGPIMFDEMLDDKLEFPGSPKIEGAGPFISSGVAVHTIGYAEEWDSDRMIRQELLQDFEDTGDHPLRGGVNASPAAHGARMVWDDARREHLSARTMIMFSEIDWYGECYQVLDAHGWLEYGGQLTSKVQQSIDEDLQQDDDRLRTWLAELHRYDKDQRKFYYLEIAAATLAPPLSRLWYAASMLSLYYLHHDDLRVGFLWSEYQTKMRFELFALKHIETAERNRENGKKGGQSEKAQERYSVLDRLARARFKDFAFASDPQGRRLARQTASEYDREADPQLFTVNGRLLSERWFGDWLAHFRQVARGDE